MSNYGILPNLNLKELQLALEGLKLGIQVLLLTLLDNGRRWRSLQFKKHDA